jgi:hypothetical protein
MATGLSKPEMRGSSVILGPVFTRLGQAAIQTPKRYRIIFPSLNFDHELCERLTGVLLEH